ncbi:hypothetical protein ABID94_006392 [Streptomyces sp. PvR018]|nr:DNA primase [Streptomyces sp. 2R]QTA32637.1 hypothetical protein JHY03_27960 [Streptomyces sp. CA-256286]
MKRVGRTRAQAADVPLDDEAGAEADDEEEAEDEDDDEALDFASEPVDEDDPESDDFEDDVAGVLLDEEPRLSFR